MSVSGKRLISGSSHAFPWSSWVTVAILSGLATGIFWWNSPLPTATQQNMLLAAVAVTGLIALGTLWQATYGTFRHFRYRGLGLELTPEAAVAGSEFSGALLVPVPFQAGREFKVAFSGSELTAQRYRESKSDTDSYRTITRPLHGDACTASSEASGAGTLLRFAFRLPADAPQSLGYGEPVLWTNDTADRVYVKWYLQFSADVPGVDLDETFEIPVVRPGAAELQLREGENPSFVMARSGNALNVTQPAFRKPGKPGSAANMLGAGMMASAMLIGWDLGGSLGALLFFAGAVPLAAIGAYLSHELIVTLSAAELRIVRRIGKVALIDVRIERTRIKAVEVVPSFGLHADGIAPRTVRVRTAEGRTYALAEFMTRTRDILALCNLVAGRLALAPQAIAGARELQRPQPAHVYEQPQAPGVKFAGTLVVLAIAGWLTWPWFDAFYQANWGDGKAAQAAAAAQPAAAVDATSARWWRRFERANAEISARRFDEAEREFQRILSDIERESGPGHPHAGLLHYHLAMNYGNQRRKADREAALKRSLDIFEQHPVKDVKQALGPLGWAIDRESVARELGDLLWDRRRPADAFAYYQKAYAAASEIDASEEVRNDRFALASAGVMVTSCTLQKWDVADRAMAELKQRYPAASPGIQPTLKYWIDGGGPRLDARKC